MTTTLTTKKSGTQRAGKRRGATKPSLPDVLQQQCRKIRKLVAQADRQDVQVRYQIAVHCQDVQDGDGNGKKYGANAVRKLAKSLNWSKSAVYGYAKVASVWRDKSTFDELVARIGKSDKALSWTHFVLLATVSDDVEREQLVQDCLQNGQSVRELQMKIQTGSAMRHEPSDATQPEPQVRQALAAVIQDFGSQVAAFKRRAGTFGQHLVAKISASDPSDFNDASLDQLLAARHDLTALIEQLDATIGQFADRRKSLPVLPDGNQVPVAGHSDEHMQDDPHEDRLTTTDSASQTFA